MIVVQQLPLLGDVNFLYPDSSDLQSVPTKNIKKYKLILPSFVMTLTVVAQLYGHELQIRAIGFLFYF